MEVPYGSLEGVESAGSWSSASSSTARLPDVLGADALSVAIIGPGEHQRSALARQLSSLQGSTTKEFSGYPSLDDLPQLLQVSFDVVIIELDSNPEHALELVENICSDTSITVMVYSNQVRPEMLMRCMQAGAREYLSQPFTAEGVAEAMIRAAVRRPASQPAGRASGKVLVFVGAKGGSGVTTISSNFAVALSRHSGKNVALIDLNLPFGNAALDLGIKAQYSSATAFANTKRLDSNYLSSLLVKHNSGLSVLSAPDKYVSVHVSQDAIERLLQVTRQNFDYVVVDAGSHFDAAANPLFDKGSTVYLVLQVGVAELRNANRLIFDVLRPKGIGLEVVINRFTQHALSMDDDVISKALTVPISWKIPSDFKAVRSAQNTATPLVDTDNTASRVIRQMAEALYAPTDHREAKKKKFKLFG